MSTERDSSQPPPASAGPPVERPALLNRLPRRPDSGSPGQRTPAAGSGQEDKKDSQTQLGRRLPFWLMLLLLLAGNYFVGLYVAPDVPDRLEVPYTLFRQQVTAGNVAEIVSRGDAIQGTFKEAVTYPLDGDEARTSTTFDTQRPAFADPGLEAELFNQGVVINARPLEEPRGWLLTVLISFGPAVLMVGVIVWISRRAARQMGGMGGAFGLGRSTARRVDKPAEDEKRVTFEDVAGIEEAEQELVEIVDFLKNPPKYTRLGGTVPKGVLLVGSPGTGKTLLARAVAGEAGVPFFSMGASEFVEMIVGVGASRVRDLFKQAREAAPSIIFIDELDAIGRARGSGVLSGGHSEQEQTLNQILTEMDGFSSREGVIVLAATNRPDVLDPALLRPGRFDRRVTVNPPDRNGREAILRVHTRNVPLAPDVDLMIVASSTPGLVGADLRNLVNEAALQAARREADAVYLVDFMDALEKLILGPARDLLMSSEERERVAYHEGGHTILGLVVPGADPVNRVTIMPRGQALGVTYQRPEADRHNYHEGYLRARITGALGGRAAEAVIYGSRTTGSESDMEQATNMARQMVTRWGMSEALGPVTLAQRANQFLPGQNFGGQGGNAFSEATSQLVDSEVRRILDECYDDAVRLLRDYRQPLEVLAAALLDRETLDEDEILRVTGLPRAPQLETLPIPARAGGDGAINPPNGAGSGVWPL
jgi:cell division protease FtsH